MFGLSEKRNIGKEMSWSGDKRMGLDDIINILIACGRMKTKLPVCLCSQISKNIQDIYASISA